MPSEFTAEHRQWLEECVERHFRPTTNEAIRAALARIDELERVLRPFADYATTRDELRREARLSCLVNDMSMIDGLVAGTERGKLPTIGDCRAARAALEKK